MSADLSEYNYSDEFRFTLRYRKETQGYNNGVQYSHNHATKDRETYFGELEVEKKKQEGKDLFDISKSQKHYRSNIIYRLAYATSQKLKQLYQQLQDEAKKLGSSPRGLSIHDLMQIFEIYQLTHKSAGDNYSYDFWNELEIFFPGGTKKHSEKNYHNLVRIFEDIEQLSHVIFKEKLTIGDTQYIEYGSDLEYNGVYNKIQETAKLDLGEIADEEENEEEDGYWFQKTAAAAAKNANEAKPQFQLATDKDILDLQRIEDIKNSFKEFYDRFKHIIFEKEFWAFFLSDILSDLKSNKSNVELEVKFMAPEYIGDVDAVQYLLTSRHDILRYGQFIDIEQEKRKQEAETRKKKSKEHDLRPSNFGVNGLRPGMSSEYQAYDEGSANTNYEILAMLGMNQEEIEKERKLGLKQQKIVQEVQKKANEPPRDDNNNIDFIKMPDNKLVTCLPLNTQRNDFEDYIVFDVPPPFRIKKMYNEDELIPMSSFEDWVKAGFGDMKFLNPIQTTVKPCAFDSDDNMLVCAPTGAGKTNVALMTVLREIGKNIDKDTRILKDNDFKMVYISPMKALAAEVVDKFSQRLKYLGVRVKELTGDMQLSKTEIAETHILVCTPEKWDVITRKSDGISAMLKLIIIDEIHLLNDERGPVLECIVARTLRMIERNQTNVRLVGLSATLPNPLDVATFLRVNEKKGFFFFGAEFRPIPLHQKFIGVKEEKKKSDYKLKSNDPKAPRQREKKMRIEDRMNEVAYEFARKYLEAHQQVMIFTHSRKDTINTADYFLQNSGDQGESRFFKIPSKDHGSVGKIKNRDLARLCSEGIGFHNAGLLRRDRNIVEKLFLEGKIRVLCTTATLAWGVNLPAHAVIIKGTDVYQPNHDKADLSILDVQQIFGRAGRPQFDTKGEAIMITRFEKVNHYLGLMTNATEIESKFMIHMKEALNAEVALGTVTNLWEAKEWLKYTFYYIRLCKRPNLYKKELAVTLPKDSIAMKADIEEFLHELLTKYLKEIHELRLVRYDPNNQFLNSTELGRIASHYYIKCETMTHFCKELKIHDDTDDKTAKDVHLSDERLLSIVSRAKEFENIRIRPDEALELNMIAKGGFLKSLGNDYQKASTDKNVDKDQSTTVHDDSEKVFVLIQAYLMHVEFENSSLIADTIYIVQNVSRILRCMLDICLKKNLAIPVEVLGEWCKLIENRMKPDDHPLEQFCHENNVGNYSAMKSRKEFKEGFLHRDLIDRIYDFSLEQLKEMEPEEISYKLNLKQRGQIIKKFVSYIPTITAEWSIKPIAQTIMKMVVTVNCEFAWTSRWHLRNEIFTIIVDDEIEILHSEQIAVNKRSVETKEGTTCSFFIPYRGKDSPNVIRLRIVADRWIGSEYIEPIELDKIVVQQEMMEYTKLLNLQPLPIAAFNNPDFEKLYRVKYFNPIQTQVFHSLYHTDNNILIGAPTGSGKTIMSEIGVMKVFRDTPQKKVIYIAPLKAIAKERLKDWKDRLEKGHLKKKVLELTGDFTPDLEALKRSDVLITTPEKWDGISRNWQNRSYVTEVALIIMDEIHLLGQDRGPVLEVIVSRMNYISNQTGKSIRMIGLSTALANGVDVANWFGVKKHHFFNFKPQVRPCPITIHFEGFSEKHYCPRMATMNKPAYNAIKKFSEGKPVLIFVSSRRQTRLTALDLIALVAADISIGQNLRFLNMHPAETESHLEQVQDIYLKQTLAFGIGMHHAGLVSEDRRIVEDLFVNNKINILIATSTLAWGVNFPAHLVIVKGTEFYDAKNKRYVDMPITDILQMIGRAGRPQFDDRGVASVFVEQSKKNFYRRYLNDPFPVESSLSTQLSDHLNAEISGGTLKTKQDCIDYLTWTYYFRRVVRNPAYYGVKDNNHDTINKFLLDLVNNCLKELETDGVITIEDENKLAPTFLGQIASSYYIKHESAAHFKKKVTAGLSIIDLVKILSYAKEYEEIPVRHNEDNYNEALAKICPYKGPDKNYESPNLKTFLLFQMHFGRLPPPIRDYVTDCKLIVDSCIRFVHALIDVSAENNYLDTTLNLCSLMQMLVQGNWANESSLKNVPHFSEQIIKTLHEKEGISYLAQLIGAFRENKLRNIIKKHKFDLTDEEIGDIEECVDYIPDVSFRVNISAFNSEKFERIKDGSLEPGNEALLTVNIKRENSHHPLAIKMERFSKIKDATWWIVVANEYKNEILALKRLYFKDKARKDMQINLPESFKESPMINVYLISDSYMGIDQVFTVRFPQQEKKQ